MRVRRCRLHAGTQSTGQGTRPCPGGGRSARYRARRSVDERRHRPRRRGGGTHSDRSMRIGGALMMEASERMLEQAGRGGRCAGPSRSPRSTSPMACSARRGTTCGSACTTSRGRSRQSASGDCASPCTQRPRSPAAIPAYPTGCAVCESQIDPETGAIAVTRTPRSTTPRQPINPLVLHGQVHGGSCRAWARRSWRRCLRRRRTDVQRELHGLPRCRAPITVPAFDVELSEGSDRGQSAADQGRRRGRRYAGARRTINAVVDALDRIRHRARR